MTQTAVLMVIDSSALTAILRREPEEPHFRNAIKLGASRLLSASTRVQAGIVALARAGEAGLGQVEALQETRGSKLRRSRRPCPARDAGSYALAAR